MTEIVRWDPSRPLSLMEAMDRFLEEGLLRPWAPFGWEPTGSLAVDMYETNDAFVIKAAAAGVKPEDIEVNISNNVLTISGEIREEKKEEGARYHRLERRYGRFERSLALPARVNADKVKATLKDGVLTVEVPKVEEDKRKKVRVNVQ